MTQNNRLAPARVRAIAVLAVALATECTSIVRKPEINNVTRVAVLSVFANQTVSEQRGRGVVTQWDDSFRLEVAADALAILEAQLGQVGWRVVPGSTVVQSAEYQQAFKPPPAQSGNEAIDSAVNTLSGMMVRQEMTHYFTPPGMYPIQVRGEKNYQYSCVGNACPPDPKEVLARLAQQLDVDVVVLTQLDYCYQGGSLTSFGGFGEAKMSAGSVIRAVSREGKLIIDMDDIPRCGGKTRALSDNSMLMNGGNLVFMTASRDKMRAMFAQATNGSITLSIAQIKDAMK